MTDLTEHQIDVIDRLARIEEGVKGLYPRMDAVEKDVAAVKVWKTRLTGAVFGLGAGLAYLGQNHLQPILALLH